MAIIRTGGGYSGIAEYLKEGQKRGRGYSRDQLDNREPLNGVLDTIDAVISGMDRDDKVERYLHITTSFKEDHVPRETLAKMDDELKAFITAAYTDGELGYYSEIHAPKIKSYIDNGGEKVDRRIHVHTVIPTINMITGERANPLEMVTARYGTKWATNDFLKAFQEDQNDRYGLASPDDNQRLSGGKAGVLDRVKSDKSDLTPSQDFQRRNKQMRVELMNKIIAGNVTTYAEFKKLAGQYGKIENGFTKDKTPYLKIKQEGDSKFMRLDEAMFTREFIALPTTDKIAKLEAEDKHEYIEPKDPVVQASEELAAKRAERATMIQYWHDIRSREIRYISPGSRFFKDHYRSLSDSEKIACLDTLEGGQTYDNNNFTLAPTSAKFNSYTIDQVIENQLSGEQIVAGDKDAISAMIDELTQHQSAFTQNDISNYLLDRIDIADEENYNTAIAQIMQHPDLVVLEKDGKKASEAFTSATIYKIEQNLIAVATRLKGEQGIAVSSKDVDTSTMNRGQKAALDDVLSGKRIAIVNGAAGTGKSFMLDKSRQAFEDAGYVLHGVCLQGKTAEDLESGSGIKSGTLHSFLSKYDSGKVRISDRSVIVLDEAGMVGSEQWNRLVSICDSTGARLVAVGDIYQVQAVSYGSAFDRVSNIIGVSSLTEIMRQKTEWQNAASGAFSTHNIKAGLEAYAAHGNIKFEADQLDALDVLVKQVSDDRHLVGQIATDISSIDPKTLDEAIKRGLVAESKDGSLAAGLGGSLTRGSSLVICKTNDERIELNRLIRDGLIADGIVKSEGGSHIFKADGRRVDLAEGDKIMFTASDRDLKVKNGTTGTVSGVDADNIYFDVEGRHISVPREADIEIEQAYAVTINKSQGMTVDRAYILASEAMTANDIYVAGTRHKGNMEIYASREQFKDFDTMVKSMEAVHKKEFTGEREGKQVDVNALDRMVREQNVDSVIERDAKKQDIKTLNNEIDLHDLLNRLENEKGLDSQKYSVNKEKNLIVAGSRELSAVQFMTEEMEMKMDYQKEALPMLQDAYAQQLRGAYVERKESASREELSDFKVFMQKHGASHQKALADLNAPARIEKNEARLAGNDIDQIQAKLESERKAVDRQFAKPNRQLFDDFRSTQEQISKRAEAAEAAKAVKPILETSTEKELYNENDTHLGELA